MHKQKDKDTHSCMQHTHHESRKGFIFFWSREDTPKKCSLARERGDVVRMKGIDRLGQGGGGGRAQWLCGQGARPRRRTLRVTSGLRKYHLPRKLSTNRSEALRTLTVSRAAARHWPSVPRNTSTIHATINHSTPKR